jgi:hypothetical protein
LLATVSLWGIVVENLINMFGEIWKRILQNRDQSIDDIIVEQLEPLAWRLDRTLGHM